MKILIEIIFVLQLKKGPLNEKKCSKSIVHIFISFKLRKIIFKKLVELFQDNS
jgi:hypothetical protein